MKTYVINISMKWSEDVTVQAKTKAEAKKKAWQKFSKRPQKKSFDFLIDEA